MNGHSSKSVDMRETVRLCESSMVDDGPACKAQRVTGIRSTQVCMVYPNKRYPTPTFLRLIRWRPTNGVFTQGQVSDPGDDVFSLRKWDRYLPSSSKFYRLVVVKSGCRSG